MVTPETITAIAPELSNETPETLQLFIGMAQSRISKDVWKSFYDQGVMFLAAHMLTMRKRRGASGSLTTQKVGDLEVQNSDMTTGRKSDSSFLQTSYGAEYLTLREYVVVKPMSI